MADTGDGEPIFHLGPHSIKDFLRSEVDGAASKVALDGPPIGLFEIGRNHPGGRGPGVVLLAIKEMLLNLNV